MFFYLKKYFILIAFCSSSLLMQSQQNTLLKLKTDEYQKLIAELTPKKTKKNKRGLGNLLLNIYQKHISVQISADCLYSLSCSRYSREIVNKKGLILGVLLSADRLTRCSGFCAKDIPERKYNENGFVEDNP
jgi:putative component of membrane protein insertase Oxa1/YidC/SpoIIIJ protein YidD